MIVQLSDAYERAGRAEDAERVLHEGLERFPANRALSVALAARLLAQGRPDEAYEVVSVVVDSIRKIPEPGERAAALLVAGRAAARAGSLERAEELLQEAAGGGSIPDALAVLGEVQAESGRLEAAEATLRKAWQLDPARVGVLLDLARVLERAGKRGEALEELAAASRGGDERRFAIGPVRAELLIRDGDHDRALALADEFARDGGGMFAASQIRGMVALATGDVEKGEAEFRRMSQLREKDAVPLLYLARLALARGDLDAARAAFEEALGREPDLAEAELGLLDVEERIGDVTAARARAERLLAGPDTRARAVRALLASPPQDDWKSVLARIASLRAAFPDDRGLRLHEALFRLVSGDGEGAAAQLAELVAEDPESTSAFALLASAHEQNSDAVEAMEILGRLAASEPRFAAARIVLARLYVRLGRRDLARAQLDAAVTDQPDLGEARELRAKLAAAEGDREAAIADLEALRQGASDVEVLGALAELRFQQGERGESIRLLEEARSIQPGNVTWPARLAQVLARDGQVDRSLSLYAESQRLAPTFPAAHEDGLVLLANGRNVEAKVALKRAFERTNDPRFAGALAAAACLAGQPREAVEPVLAWRTRMANAGDDVVAAHAMVLVLAGDRGRAEAILRSSGIPDAVERTIVTLGAGPGSLPAEARLAFEIFAFRAAGWDVERLARVELSSRESALGPLATWWALESVGRTETRPEVRLTLARRLAGQANDEPGPGLALAVAQLDAGDRDDQLATLRRLASKFPEDPTVALFLGMAYEAAGDGSGAIREYTRAIGVPNPSAAALNNLAWRLGEDPSRRQAAIEHARRAVRIAPKNGQILDTLGWLLYQDGQVEEGTRILERAVAAAPRAPTLRYHLARALEARGQPRRARSQIEMALLARGFPEEDAARKLLARLDPGMPAADSQVAATATPLDVDRPVEAALGAGGRSVYRVAAGTAANEVSIAFRAPEGGATSLTVLRRGEPLARLDAAPGEEVAVSRFRLDPTDHLFVVRSESDQAVGSFRLAVESTAPPSPDVELEPNDAPAVARPFAPGERRSGRFHGASDVDTYRLAIRKEEPATLRIEAGSGTEVLGEVLSSSAEPAKAGRLAPGAVAVLSNLAAPAEGHLVLRLSPGVRRGGPGESYRLELAPGPGQDSDPEPNDRPRDALALDLARPAKGAIGPLDPVDWYRLDAPGRLLSIRLVASAKVALEIWDDEGDLALRRRQEVEGPEGNVPRWQSGPDGRIYVAVLAAPGESSATYEITIDEAFTPEVATEVEPNDRASRAMVSCGSEAVHGSLDLASDIDWFLIPVPRSGQTVSVVIEAPQAASNLVLDLFSLEGNVPRFLGRWSTAGGQLELPAVLLAAREAAVALSSEGGPAGPYEITVRPVAPSARLENEPNDETWSALALRRFGILSGRLSGSGDRDLIRIESDGPVTVRATGDSPIAVRFLDEAESHLVSPGQEVRLPGRELGLLELGTPSGGSPARPVRTYEIREESEQ